MRFKYAQGARGNITLNVKLSFYQLNNLVRTLEAQVDRTKLDPGTVAFLDFLGDALDKADEK